MIPETVEKMEPMAVRATLNLSNIEINNVAVVEHNNIKECMNLETVTVRGVEEYPFGFISDNPQLKTINIEGNINYFGGTSLSGNLSLEAYNVADSNCYAVDGVLYAGSTLFSYPAAKSGEQFVIQPSVKRIAKGAFDSTKNLQKLICPKGLEFDTQCISYPVNPIDVYLSDLDKIHFVDNKKTGMFMSSVGGHIYAPTQATLDSILAVAGTAINGMTAEIGVIPVESVEVENEFLTIRKGKTADIEYTVSPAYATEQVQFEATGDVCSVTTDGIVTGIKSGTGTVTIKNSNGVLKTINVKVKTPVESMQFASDKYEMDKGDVQKLRLTYKPEDADIEDIDWKSSDEKVLKFNEKGEAVAMGAGTAEVTATCENVTAKCKVTVKVPLESISMSEDKKTINKGSSFDLDITMNPTDATVTTKAAWTSNNEEIATVDQNGKVTAVGAGTTTITAMLEGKETTCRVTVKVPLESISMSETKKTVNKGDSFKLDITKNPTDTTVTGDVKWTSDNKKVATVDKDGNVTAVGAGTATITARLEGKETTCKVTVKVPLESISMSETKKTVNKGDSFDLDITKNPTDTTVDAKAAWSSANAGVATVDQNGMVTAVGAGTTVITANLEGKETTCEIVVKVPLESIEMSEKEISLVEDGEAQLNVIYAPTDTTVEKNVAWISSKPDVAVVDQAGKVTAKTVGTATISAEVDGKTTTCKVTVTKKPVALESIELSEAKITMVEMDKKQLTVKYNPSNTTVDRDVAWTTSNNKVAVVAADGTITAKGAGTATITATVAGKNASCVVTVKRKEVALESIELSETNVTMKAGNKKQLNVIYNPANTTVEKNVKWSTTDADVASVDKNGMVTAKSEGTVTITASVDGKNATCEVNVEKADVIDIESIQINEQDVHLTKGDEKQLTVSYSPTNATVDKTVNWSSDNADVVSVDNNGKLVAKGVGVATITAEMSGKTAICKVTVKEVPEIVNPEEESDKNNSVNGEVTGENPETTESSNSSVPKTGDAGSANLLMGMLTSAAAGVSGLLARKRKKATDKDEK